MGSGLVPVAVAVAVSEAFCDGGGLRAKPQRQFGPLKLQLSNWEKEIGQVAGVQRFKSE